MRSNNLIGEKIQENAVVKINYKSDIDGQPHFIKGVLTGENEGSYFVEGLKFGDILPISKNMIISMIFPKSKDEKPKPAIIPDPVTKTQPPTKQKFSYSKWWEGKHVQEAD